MVAAYFTLAGITVLAWLPLLLRFYRNWIARDNPISLSICGFIVLLIWLTVAGIWVVTGDIRSEIVTFVSAGASLAIAIYTHWSFYWARKKFDWSRGE